MRRSLLWSCLLSLTAWCSVPASDPVGTGTLTLKEAIRLGLERNPNLAVSRASTLAADASTREARSGLWPRIVLEAGARRSDHQVTVFGDKLTAGVFAADDFALDNLNDPDAVSHLNAAVALEVPLFTGGRIRSGIDAAQGANEASRAQLRADESDLAVRITEAYFGVALARAAVTVSESAVADAHGHESVAAARFEAGSALRSDVLRAQVLRLSRERDLARKMADVEMSFAQLRRLIGASPGEAVAPSTVLEAPGDPLGPLDAWVARSLQRRPEIEAARRRFDVATALAGYARAAVSPEVAGLARYERNAGGFDGGEGSYLIGVSLRWTAFDRARVARIDAADAHRAAADAGVRGVEDAVRFEVEQAWLDAGVADRSLAVAREAVSAAEAARRITSERYGGGLLPLTDLLSVETELVSARLGEIAAIYDAIVGRVRLSRASGSLEVPR